jgi:flagellin
MPTVNSNGAAMFALNKMTITERDMTTAMERLSSGKRINHAGDDAAGAAIADRMTAQIKGLEQSVRNAGDVISMAQVTEGALDETSSIIQRIRELAIQSASDVMNAEERSYLDAEVIQMMAELDRVTRDTTFNEIAVLDGSFADRRFQIGTHEREFASLSISSMRIDAIGAFKAVTDKTDSSGINSNLALNAYAVAETSDANLVQSEAFTIHGILGSSSVTAAAGSTVRDIATSVNAVFNATGVGAIASTQLKIEAKSLDDAYNGQTSVSFSIEGKNATAITVAANITLSNAASSSVLSGLRDSINNYTTTTGVTATLSTDKSSIIMVQNEGYDIKLGTVNFDGDTTSTGSRRTLMVTSLDNNELVAGNAVLLGDTSATTTDVDGIYSGTASGVLTIGGKIGTTTPTAFTSSGPLSKATDDDAIVVNQTMATGFTGTQSMTMVNTATVHNSFVTVTSSHAQSADFVITGTDLNGDVLTETIAAHVSGTYPETKTTTNIFATITSVKPSTNDADGSVKVGVLNTIVNQAALVTITSSASSETGKTFTVVGTGMDGTALTEVITGPGATLTVTGRQIFRTIHTVTTSAATAGAITIGVKAADSVIVTGQLEMSSSNSFTVVGEDGKGLFELSPGAATLDKLSGVNVKTRQSSVDALRVLDRSLDRIHKERAKLGALMSRMEKAIDNLSNVALNTNASRGRIEDADFALESARLTKAQILQQSAMAMIAQAGKAQQNVLQLLQN